MAAPAGHRIRCVLFGHDWRRAIAPRDGFYLRCRRCWVSREEERELQASLEPEDWAAAAATQRPA